MSDYKYTQQDKKDVIELLRGIANELEDTSAGYTYDHLRQIAYSMVQSVLDDIVIDLNDYTDDMEISIDWNRQIEIDAGSIDLSDLAQQFVEAIDNIPNEEIDVYIDNINYIDDINQDV